MHLLAIHHPAQRRRRHPLQSVGQRPPEPSGVVQEIMASKQVELSELRNEFTVLQKQLQTALEENRTLKMLLKSASFIFSYPF